MVRTGVGGGLGLFERASGCHEVGVASVPNCTALASRTSGDPSLFSVNGSQIR